MDWLRDLEGWPHALSSRRIRCRPHVWHVQIVGEGPQILFIHGAGSSSHSWAAVIDLLSTEFQCIAIDLPGHGFTQMGSRFRSNLDRMSEDVQSLLEQQEWAPAAIVGHSAGAAVALRLAGSMLVPPPVVGINPALENFDGLAGWLFPVLAKGLALNPLTAWAFSAGPNPEARARRLLKGTGSAPPLDMQICYAKLISDRAHVDGALTMMAQWSLAGLIRDLPDLTTTCLFITATKDKVVPPKVAAAAAGRMRNTIHRSLEGLGHLAHEEDPDAVAGIIKAWVNTTQSQV